MTDDRMVDEIAKRLFWHDSWPELPYDARDMEERWEAIGRDPDISDVRDLYRHVAALALDVINGGGLVTLDDVAMRLWWDDEHRGEEYDEKIAKIQWDAMGDGDPWARPLPEDLRDEYRETARVVCGTVGALSRKVVLPGVDSFGFQIAGKPLALKVLEEASEFAVAANDWLKSDKMDKELDRDMRGEWADVLQTLVNWAAAVGWSDKDIMDMMAACRERNRRRGRIL